MKGPRSPSKRPPPEMLEEIGWLAVRWAGLETLVEGTCAYIYKHNLAKADKGQPPRAFSQRVAFIRKAMRHPLFAYLRMDFDPVLDETSELSRQRNDLMHGAFIEWVGESSGSQIVIRTNKTGYEAEAWTVSTSDLRMLSQRVHRTFASHFNLQDRMKALIRAFDGKRELGRRATFNEPG